MIRYIVRRVLLMILTLAIVSLISYIVMDLPPGDFVTGQILKMMDDRTVTMEQIEGLRSMYGLDKPVIYRYWMWISKFLRGDLGYSLSWRKPVVDLLRDRFMMTSLITLLSLMFTWVVGFPIGILSAIRKYSLTDIFWTFVGFIGLSIPSFLLALIFMFLSYKYFPGIEVGGLFSHQYLMAPWSFAKFMDLLGHLWIPVIIVGAAGTAGTIRITRANLIDELRKPYVSMARSKGISEVKTILKYPMRIALNPFLSTIGWLLPSLIAGETITAVVLGLPTAGPLFLEALQRQDMQLAGAYIMLISTLTVIGTLISDIVMTIVDPRIRYD